MTDLTREIAAVASVMDQIDNCRQPIPCDLCRQRMQSILDVGAKAERERIRHAVFDCARCGKIHEPRIDGPGSVTWAATDGHPYSAAHVKSWRSFAAFLTGVLDEHP